MIPAVDRPSQAARRVRGRPAPDNPPQGHVAPGPGTTGGAPPRAGGLAIGALAMGALALGALLLPTDYPPRRLVYPILRPEATALARDFLRAQGVDPTGFRAVTWSSAGFPRAIRDPARPELNLPPWPDDALARRYVAAAEGLEAWEHAATTLLPSASWTTRLVRRDGGDEWFVTVNPRSRAVVAFWRERPRPGAATAAGADTPSAPAGPEAPRSAEAADAAVAALLLRVAPPGPWRLDGIDHRDADGVREEVRWYADGAPPIGEARPLVTVVLRNGATVGCGAGLELPEAWVAEETRDTTLSRLVGLLRIALLIGLGGSGLVAVLRRMSGRGAEVRTAFRVALLLSIPFLLFHLNRSPTLLVRYPTAIPWSVFMASSAVGLGLSVLLQALLVALGFLALGAARSDWRTALPPAGWRPVARPALAVALTGLALGIVVDRLELLGRLRWPELFPGPTPPTLPGYGAIYPFFDVAASAAIGTIFVGGVIAVGFVLTRTLVRRRRWRAVLLVLVAVALGPDRARTVGEAVVPTLFEVLALVTAILLARRAARGLVPAYVALLPLALGGQSALRLVAQPALQARLSGIVAFTLLAVPLIILTAQALAGPGDARNHRTGQIPVDP